MNEHITEKRDVTGEVTIWAEVNPYRNHDEDPPFNYRILSGTHHYDDEAIKIITHEVTLPMPAGINLLAKAIETLEEAKAKKRETFNDEMLELNDKIKALQQIEYHPPQDDGVIIENRDVGEEEDDSIPF